jgi:hypothetical protein
MAQMIPTPTVGTNLGWAIAGLVRSILEEGGIAHAMEVHRAIERVELELGTGVRPPIRGLVSAASRHTTPPALAIAADHSAAMLWGARLDGDAWALATSGLGLPAMPDLQVYLLPSTRPEVAAVTDAATAATAGYEHPRGFGWAALESSPAQLTAATVGRFATAFHIDACVTRTDVPAVWALAALIVTAADPFRLRVFDAGAFVTDVEIDRLSQAVARRLIDERLSLSGRTAT